MTDISEFVKHAKLACESCEFESEDTGECMLHALQTQHTVSGESPEGHQVSISIEQE